MGKVYKISKNVGLGLLVLAISALATIIGLSIAYDKQRGKSQGKPVDETDTGSTYVPPTTPFKPKKPWDFYRLPDSLFPHSYNVTLWPRLKPNADGMYIFTGHSAVIFKCIKETDLIVIHANKLNFTEFLGHYAKLSGLGEAAVPTIQRTWLEVMTEYLVIQLNNTLTVEESYVLYTEFTGELADDLKGFYRSEYMDNGVKK